MDETFAYPILKKYYLNAMITMLEPTCDHNNMTMTD